jgi:hypothetical protein
VCPIADITARLTHPFCAASLLWWRCYDRDGCQPRGCRYAIGGGGVLPGSIPDMGVPV